MAEEKKESGLGEERDKLYQAYAESQKAEVPPVEEPKPEAEQPPVEAEKPVEQPPQEAPEEKKEEKPPEEKYVPKQALDEERAKRKKLRDDKEALEAELRAYREKLNPPKDPEPILDYDAEIHNLKREIETFKKMEARREQQAQEEAARQQREKTESMVRQAGVDLANEGFPGFGYMTSKITDELLKIAENDPEEAAILDNPTGWKKIYKERVYPEFKKEMENASRKITLDAKTSLKRDATMAPSSGKAPASKEEDDPNKWDEKKKMQKYLEMREKGITPGMRSSL